MFQSTPSGGKATSVPVERTNTRRSFNPRLPGGRRHAFVSIVTATSGFQSTPSGGKATVPSRLRASSTHSAFQSTPSGGKATARSGGKSVNRVVSIHAFRGEGDKTGSTRQGLSAGFNPRLPGGRRPPMPRPICSFRVFQSTPSGGKATGGDASIQLDDPVFQSTPSGGTATAISRAAVPCSRQIL